MRGHPAEKTAFDLGQKEIDELVDDWTPEPLVAPQTPFEEAENEKRPVIIGCVLSRATCYAEKAC